MIGLGTLDFIRIGIIFRWLLVFIICLEQAFSIADVPDLSSMPGDLAWCVAEKFTAQELFEAEERKDFLSLNLGRVYLWTVIVNFSLSSCSYLYFCMCRLSFFPGEGNETCMGKHVYT